MLGLSAVQFYAAMLVYWDSTMSLSGGRLHYIWRLQILVHMDVPSVILMVLFCISSRAVVCLSERFIRVSEEYSTADLMVAL